ncbi:flagellar biosynthesis protein FlhB [Bacillus sp. HMF5848]|uniref:flagellar biosynthesis protein FlhB n=1 Tax=Bacillus sp. HMF5848 TaxID=2495421 RepID=UPI00163B079A|nr:flagellar biosynthesis protein FlhB [Bacillus sp. HMF5848]
MELLQLDLQMFAGEKTEKATPKKRQESRKKGQVAKSTDVNSAFVLLAVFLVLSFTGSSMGNIVTSIFRESFTQYIHMPFTSENIHLIFIELLIQGIWVVAPVMLVAVVAGVAATYLQIGFLFSAEAIKFNLNKINPLQGAKRIFSIRSIVELLKSILKILLIGTVTFTILWLHVDEIFNLSQKTLYDALALVAKLTIQMGIGASIALLFLAILDYLYQRYDFEKNIRMSKQDIKDEYKKTEGDPLIKSKIKQKQMEMATRRMMQEVPNADVVITNPTHFAIALKYDDSNMDAPYVVAKGVDFIALKIKETAKEHDIVTVENRPLARALYDKVEIGQAIPDEFFKAVAEVLAYVYRLKQNV